MLSFRLGNLPVAQNKINTKLCINYVLCCLEIRSTIDDVLNKAWFLLKPQCIDLVNMMLINVAIKILDIILVSAGLDDLQTPYFL